MKLSFIALNMDCTDFFVNCNNIVTHIAFLCRKYRNYGTKEKR